MSVITCSDDATVYSFDDGMLEEPVAVEEVDALLKKALTSDKKQVLSLCRVLDWEIVAPAAVQKEGYTASVLQKIEDALHTFIPEEGTEQLSPNLERLSIKYLVSLRPIIDRAKVCPLGGTDKGYEKIESCINLLTDYHCKQVVQTDKLNKRLLHLEDEMRRSRETIESLLNEDLTGLALHAAAACSDDVLWDHSNRTAAAEEASSVESLAERCSELTTHLSNVAVRLESIVHRSHESMKLVDSVTQMPSVVMSNVVGLQSDVDALLASSFENSESLRLRCATDHAMLMEMCKRGEGLVKNEHSSYQDWYTQCSVVVNEHNQKLETAKQELANLPEVYNAQKRIRTDRLESLAAARTAEIDRALQQSKTMLQEFDSERDATLAELESLEAKEVLKKEDIVRQVHALQEEKKALEADMEENARQKMAVFNKMRSSIAGITEVIHPRCEDLERTHRLSSTAAEIASFAIQFLYACSTALGRDETSHAVAAKKSFTRLHKMIVTSTELLITAKSRVIYLNDKLVGPWKKTALTTGRTYSFCKMTNDPLAATYLNWILRIKQEEATHLERKAKLAESINYNITACKPSTEYLSSARVPFSMPVEAAAAVIETWSSAHTMQSIEA